MSKSYCTGKLKWTMNENILLYWKEPVATMEWYISSSWFRARSVHSPFNLHHWHHHRAGRTRPSERASCERLIQNRQARGSIYCRKTRFGSGPIQFMWYGCDETKYWRKNGWVEKQVRQVVWSWRCVSENKSQPHFAFLKSILLSLELVLLYL